MNADTIEALKGFYRFLDENGPVNFPCGDDPEPADDSSGEGSNADPESTDADSADGDKGDDSKDTYYKKLREENKTQRLKTKKALEERDALMGEVENMKKTIHGITTHLKLEPETKPEDILAKAEAKSKDADEKIRTNTLFTSFMIEATGAGMPKDMVRMAFKDSDFSEIEIDGMEVKGMAEHVTALKAKYPVLFTGAKPDDKGDGGNPPKKEDEPLKKEIEILAQRQGLSVEAAQAIHNKRVEKAKAKNEPHDFATLWGIRKNYKGEFI